MVVFVSLVTVLEARSEHTHSSECSAALRHICGLMGAKAYPLCHHTYVFCDQQEVNTKAKLQADKKIHHLIKADLQLLNPGPPVSLPNLHWTGFTLRITVAYTKGPGYKHLQIGHHWLF